MANDECLMTNQKASPNDEGGGAGRSGPPLRHCRLPFDSAFGIRHSAFGMGRHRRPERGAVMLDYVMVLAVLVPLVAYTFTKLLTLVADYFGMIAFWASWPFL
jgi:hypothetical protein